MGQRPETGFNYSPEFLTMAYAVPSSEQRQLHSQGAEQK